MRVSNVTTFILQNLRQYVSYYIQTEHDGRLMNVLSAHARFDDLDLDARSQWVSKGKVSALHDIGNQASNKHKLATTVDHFLRELSNVYIACPTFFIFCQAFFSVFSMLS